ncbi:MULTISPECIES: hypothetical protein [unclassified Enterococcus]|jgi:hypothetical protein|uniref:hypothetical protein n=1 Tax=unclassified Enterococcus TaxID=2608891 RepID=UPI003D27F2C0
MMKMKKRRSFRSYFMDGEAGVNVSWGAVFAGVITFLSLFMTLAFVGSAIGFSTLKITSDNPLEGVGTGLYIWLIIALVLSLMGAGFVSGTAARRIGLLHGFLTWATSMLVATLIITYTTVSAFSAMGSLLGNAASGIGSGTETVISTAGDAISSGFDKVAEELETVDTQELQANMNKYLKDTDVPELQPDYLNNELNAAGDTIKEAGKEILKNPDNADAIIDSTADSLQKRVEKIDNAADKNAIANAVAKNTELSQEEAQQATENIYNQLKTAADETQKQIETVKEDVKKAKSDLETSIEEARKAADEAADKTAKASIMGFLAMIIGLIITSLSGTWGANFVKEPRREMRM